MSPVRRGSPCRIGHVQVREQGFSRSGGRPARRPPWDELTHQAVESTHRLGPPGDQFVTAIRQQLQRHILVIGSHHPKVAAVQRRPGHHHRVGMVGLSAMTVEMKNRPGSSPPGGLAVPTWETVGHLLHEVDRRHTWQGSWCSRSRWSPVRGATTPGTGHPDMGRYPPPDPSAMPRPTARTLSRMSRIGFPSGKAARPHAPHVRSSVSDHGKQLPIRCRVWAGGYYQLGSLFA